MKALDSRRTLQSRADRIPGSGGSAPVDLLARVVGRRQVRRGLATVAFVCAGALLLRFRLTATLLRAIHLS